MVPLRLICRVLHVSPSGFYARQRRPPSRRVQENQRLREAIRHIHLDSDGVHGSPKLWKVLREQGERCGEHRVARLMRQEGLWGIPAPHTLATAEIRRTAGWDHDPVGP